MGWMVEDILGGIFREGFRLSCLNSTTEEQVAYFIPCTTFLFSSS